MRDLRIAAAGAGGVAALIIISIAGGIEPLVRQIAAAEREAQAAAVFFIESITVAEIANNYHGAQFGDLAAVPSPTPPVPETKVRILIVPGHRPDTGGTAFDGVQERDVVMDIADTLAAFLEENPHYETMVARTREAWHPVLRDYFDTHQLEIETFRQSQAAQMAGYIASGRFILEDEQVYHNGASSEAAMELYGINKWASDNRYDIVLHLHVNDYVGHRARVAGAYDGFAVYVPDHQYSNAAASRAIGEAIAVRLAAYHATSTLPKEDAGVVEDRELIAVGSNNSVDGAALLIEYGYIYEPQFQIPSVRPIAVADYALQTYLGLQDFFKDPVSPSYGSAAFPYDWEKVNAEKGERGPGVYALQAALRYLSYYPPAGRSFSECPISGKVGPCTRAALEAYQRAHGLAPVGTLGPQTRAALMREIVP